MTDLARSKGGGRLPTITVSCPFLRPPDPGDRRVEESNPRLLPPRPASSLAIFADAVVWSTKIVPCPFSGRRRSIPAHFAQIRSSPTQENTISALPQPWPESRPGVPCACNPGVAFARLRLLHGHLVTPTRGEVPGHGKTLTPRPINPVFCCSLFLQRDFLSPREQIHR